MVVYIDGVFLLNSLLDGLLLYFTGYLAGAERRLRRLLAAAALGGLYAAAVFFPWGAPLGWAPCKLGAAVLLVLAAYGRGTRFWRLCLVFLGLSCALAGCVLAFGALLGTELYVRGAYLLPVSFGVLALGTGACFGALWLFSRGALRHAAAGELLEAECELMGKELHLRVLHDTGNTLCDSLTGAPVLVVEGVRVAELWPEELRAHFSPSGLARPEAALEALRAVPGAPPLHLLPFRSVGTAAGLLLACPAERARIGRWRAARVTLALSPTPVSAGREYDALWGGPVQ